MKRNDKILDLELDVLIKRNVEIRFPDGRYVQVEWDGVNSERMSEILKLTTKSDFMEEIVNLILGD